MDATNYMNRKGDWVFTTKTKFMRWMMPYGICYCDDGREVLFDRWYCPICQRYPGQQPTMADPNEWISYVRQEWFYKDGTPEKRKRIAPYAKLVEWKMADQVMTQIEAMCKAVR